jgi:hypothetical protein
MITKDHEVVEHLEVTDHVAADGDDKHVVRAGEGLCGFQNCLHGIVEGQPVVIETFRKEVRSSGRDIPTAWVICLAVRPDAGAILVLE